MVVVCVWVEASGQKTIFTYRCSSEESVELPLLLGAGQRDNNTLQAVLFYENNSHQGAMVQPKTKPATVSVTVFYHGELPTMFYFINGRHVTFLTVHSCSYFLRRIRETSEFLVRGTVPGSSKLTKSPS